eukprot:CAMPEP_0180780472 /NCGR_PEP_ID=MMETSP1038_2-20121128/47028_1 /TAXON_ID=632150 /ORGANISM="Azadinium spinosum, Strain 3D9" /LENGTH=43 /DNA_ID= /DNA_START= /DNA_END= /DNA_ORIENTATION=
MTDRSSAGALTLCGNVHRSASTLHEPTKVQCPTKTKDNSESTP